MSMKGGQVVDTWSIYLCSVKSERRWVTDINWPGLGEIRRSGMDGCSDLESQNAQASATKLSLQDPCHTFAPLRTAGSTPPPAEPPKEVVGILEDGEGNESEKK